MPLLSEPRNTLGGSFFARKLLIWATHKVNDMMSRRPITYTYSSISFQAKALEYYSCTFKICKKTLLLFSLWNDCSIILYCIYALNTGKYGKKWQRFRLERGILILWYKYVTFFFLIALAQSSVLTWSQMSSMVVFPVIPFIFCRRSRMTLP